MIFNSIVFVIFFIITIALYYFFSNSSQKQNLILLIASYFFYGYTDCRMLLLLFASTIVYYLIGLRLKGQNETIDASENNVTKDKFLISMGCCYGAGLLLYFKYLNFFVESFTYLFNNLGLQCNTHTFNIIMPLGISFFTFRLISYPIEVYRGNMPPCRNLINFATYVAYFPTIVSGPIDRPNKFIPQLEKIRYFSYTKSVDGCRQILWGLLQKTIADNIALYVNVYWTSGNASSLPELILSASMYSFQLYFDFAGYSNMAIGISKTLGINVAKNFENPYFARCISEFWRRWHMSLTSWFTDYVYIPLGGNRKGKHRMMLNTMIVFGLCGLWHGANWTYVIWGLYCGITMCIASLNAETKNKWKHAPVELDKENILNIILVFIVVSIGWILFRANSIDQILTIAKALLYTPLDMTMPLIPKRAIMLTTLTISVEWCQRNKEHPLQINGLPYKWLYPAIYYTIVILIFIFGTQNETFIYAQF